MRIVIKEGQTYRLVRSGYCDSSGTFHFIDLADVFAIGTCCGY